MSKQVDKWLEKGRKNCKKGQHWFILTYPEYEICPVCGLSRIKDTSIIGEYNGYIVCEPTIAEDSE